MIFSKARDGKARLTRRRRAIRFLSNVVLRPPRRRKELDEATASRRAAQRQHPRHASTRPRTPATTTSATGRKPKRSANTSTCSTAKTRCPKTIIYNNNPIDNYVFSTAIGSFQDGKTPGKIQFGSGWWFLDQKEGIEWQLNALSNNGLFGRFVGMLTDSRSFMSFPRHEYFRRVLCNLLGRRNRSRRTPARRRVGRHNNPQYLLRERKRVSWPGTRSDSGDASRTRSARASTRTRPRSRVHLTNCASSRRACDSPANTPADTDTSPPASHRYQRRAPAHRPDT